ncbi:MAG: sulfite exporter TauE/SafE family protein [Rickettsiaceae bacterium H1]|nr:sulfite exporter TauE/SafE family protein [Rickettsiaceae bacterium H1]
MQIYLPIAEMSVEIFWLLLLGISSGLMAGVFGIGGNFIVIPTLIFIGIPPAISLSSAVNHTVASSFSSFLTHLKRKNVDLKMGCWLLIGSFIGSSAGAILFSLLYEAGFIDITISLLYVIVLGITGITIAIESTKAIYNKYKNTSVNKKKSKLRDFKFMPYRQLFPQSGTEASILSIILIGVFIGMLVALAGLGGGFILVPTLIYVIGLPTSFAIGTSVFQAVFTTTIVTLLHATISHTVDIVLSLLLIIGAVIGAQIGVRINSKLQPEIVRMLLAIIVLGVFVKFLSSMLITPKELYSFEYK